MALCRSTIASIAIVLATTGCVATARTRPTSSEATAGPPPAPAAERTAGQLVARTPRAPAPEPTPDPRSRPGFIWVRGYWHWDGVGWVWKAGRWERESPPWTRGK